MADRPTLTADWLRDEVTRAFGEYGLALTADAAWPYPKDQGQVGSSSIIVTYPPKRVLPDIHTDKRVFDPDFYPPGISVYVHVPVCTGRCRYCGFFTWTRSEVETRRYADAVIKEILRVGGLTGVLERSEVVSVYFGGGTPTALESDELGRLVTRALGQFRLSSDVEITVEASPETVATGDKPALLRDLGVTRVSLGVQSFDSRILEHMGRRHTPRVAEDGISALRAAGHGNINVDLIKGYPGMTLATVADDLSRISATRPDSVTTYELTLRHDSTLHKDYMQQRRGFLRAEEQIEQSAAYDIGLRALGYEVGPTGWYTLDASAQYRQQYHKWVKDIPLLAFGNSAYGYYNRYQYYNVDLWTDYVRQSEANQPVLACGYRLPPEEVIHRRAVFGIKAGLEYPFSEGHGLSQHEEDAHRAVGRTLARLVERHLVEKAGRSYELSFLGRVFSEHVASEFYSRGVATADDRDTKLRQGDGLV